MPLREGARGVRLCAFTLVRRFVLNAGRCNESMGDDQVRIIPYTATSLSVVGRFIFMFLLYRNKSTNTLSLLFCILSIASSGMWIYYSVRLDDMPMIVRSSVELTLLSASSVYIIRNKIVQHARVAPLLT